MELTIKINEDRKQLAFDIFVTALEGGIGYWSICENYHWKKKNVKSEKIGDDEDLDGFYADVIETDDPEETDAKKHKIDYSTIEKGLKRICETDVKLSETIKNSIIQAVMEDDGGNIDADSADVIVQIGLFNEIVYG